MHFLHIVSSIHNMEMEIQEKCVWGHKCLYEIEMKLMQLCAIV